jgi:hypothetical protein
MDDEIPAHITQIIRAAVAAPSGDNSQPWHFVYRAPGTIEFHAHPEKDHPMFNVDDSGTLIALGAAVENASLEARALGYQPTISVSVAEPGSLAATLQLAPGGDISADDASLQEVIHHRVSNRKAYANRSFDNMHRQALLQEVNSVPGVSFLLLEDRDAMRRTARNLTNMERIALSYKKVHHLFFAGIFWSDERNEAGEPGLHIKTLELPPPAQALFRILRHWKVAQALARIGFPNFVAKTNAAQNASASALGCVTSPTLDAKAYFNTGRLLERLWLRSTALGMSFQVVTGLLFLTRHMEREGDVTIFSAQDVAHSQETYKNIGAAFGVGANHPVITFRVGYGKPPTRRSQRMAPVIEVVHS